MPEMKKMIEKISKEIVKTSPEMDGIKPTVEEIEPGIYVLPLSTFKKLNMAPVQTKAGYRFSYRKEVRAPDGSSLIKVLHVTTDLKGKIIKSTGN